MHAKIANVPSIEAARDPVHSTAGRPADFGDILEMRLNDAPSFGEAWEGVRG